MLKNYDFFSNMGYGVHYYVVKFQLKTLPVHGEMKKTNYIRGLFEPNCIFSLGGEINQIIV